MRGIWLEGGEVRVRSDLPVPRPEKGEALVRVSMAGICNTDQELVSGYYPFRGVLGHEFVGVVEVCPDDRDWEGRRVVGEINAVCGTCLWCLEGSSSHCPNRTVLGIVGRDGVFAEYFVLPVRNLHAVPESVSDRAAVFAEPLAAACRILEQVAVSPWHRVLVLGAGKLGQLVARVLVLTGAAVRVVARHPRQQEALAAAEIAQFDAATEPAGFDLAVDCSGTAAGLRDAVRLVRPSGTVVLKSTYQGTGDLDFSSVVVDEIRLVGSRCGPFAPALEMLEQGRVNPEPLVDGVVGLNEAADMLRSPSAMRGRLKLLVSP